MDRFNFFLRHDNRQLATGYTRNQPDYGLELHIVDWGKLGSAPDNGDPGPGP